MYFFSTFLDAGFDDAILATKDALKRRGLEVIAEIDMRTAFRRHLALEFRPYVILSVYHPTLAHRAIAIDDEIGSVLFCNVIVQRQDDGRVDISAADPDGFMHVANHVELDRIIHEIRDHLQMAIEEIKTGPGIQPYSPSGQQEQGQMARVR